MPLVSVIVPVYNVERYLGECLESILGQTFRDFEVILVDDGSPDYSGNICDEYVTRDRRVRVIHQQNGGVSVARQAGMDIARGEYTIHVDPDDWVEPTMLSSLYAKAKEEEADMVICDFYMNSPCQQAYIRQKPSNLNHETVLRELFQHLHGSCWNKLIRRVCYNKYFRCSTWRNDDKVASMQKYLRFPWNVVWNILIKRELCERNNLRFAVFYKCCNFWLVDIYVLECRNIRFS